MLDVNVTIKLSETAGSVGFGVPLILVSGSTKEVAYGEYADLDEVLAAGYADDSEACRLFKVMKMQNNKPKLIGIMETAAKAADTLPKLIGKVRQVITVLGTTDSTAAEVARFIEGTESMVYFPTVSAIGGIDVFEHFDRTMVGVHSDGKQTLSAALVGASAGHTAGSFTYKNLQIKGVVPDNLKDAEVKKINNTSGTGKVYAYTIQNKAGDIVTTEGKSAAGEYMDVVDSFDWIIQNIGMQTQRFLNSTPKVPYTDAGIGSLEAIVTGVLKEADNMGIIAHDESGTAIYDTQFGSRAQSSAADREKREYTLGRFSFDLAGAIHAVSIHGTAMM